VPLRNLPIRTRLAVTFVALAAVVLLAGATGVLGMQRLASGAATVFEQDVVPMDYLNRISLNFLMARVDVRDALLSAQRNEPARVAEFHGRAVEQVGQVEALSRQYAVRITSDAERRLFDEYIANLAAFKAVAVQVIEATRAGDVGQAADLILTRCIPGAEQVKRSIEALMAYKQSAARQHNEAGARSARSALLLVGLLVLIGAAGSLLFGLAISRSIVRPVGELETAARSLAAGRLDMRVDDSGADEIGALARSFNGALREVEALVREVTAAVHATSTSAAASAAEAERIAAIIRRQTEDARHASGRVGQIAQVIAGNAESAGNAAAQAGRASETARATSEAVGQTIAGMNELAAVVVGSSRSVGALGVRSEQIGRIVEVISGVADQTGLLALNAAIEAARAGEQGRGFAVVADEVRKLAERTQQATREIAATIEAIQHDTNEAVRAMEAGTARVEHGRGVAGQAAEAIRDILERTAELDRIIGAVAGTSRAEAQAGEEAARTVAAIGEASAASLAAVDGLAAEAKRLGALTAGLEALVARFRTAPAA
jgi:methyl-accepting chemotaxis protein